MNNEELILERLDRLESQIAPLTASAKAVSELRDEMAPRLNEAVHALIAQLADVEADFQLEDLLYLIKKAMRNVKNFNFALDQLRNLIDFALTAEPLLKSTVPELIFFLDELERKGVFRLANTGLEVLKRIGESYTSEDVQQLGDGLVHLMGTLKKLNTLESLELLDKAAEMPAKIDMERAKAVGLMDILRAMGDEQVKQGMGIMMELTRAMAHLKA